MIKTRKQYEIIKTDVCELVYSQSKKMFELPVSNKVLKVQTSENRLYRMYGKTEIRTKNGVKVEVGVAEGFIIMDFDHEIDNPFLIPAIIKNGFLYNNKVYREVLQSASQTRQGKAMFTSFPVDEVRDRMVYGAKFGDAVVMAKVEARYGLALSSTIDVGCDFTYKVIPDLAYKTTKKVRIVDNDKVIECDKELTLNAADGMGTIEVMAAATVAWRLGILSNKEYEYFDKNYESLDKMDKKLLKIFNKIPSAFQIRYAGAKGLLVVYPHSKHGITEDMCFTESMWKYEPDRTRYPEIPLEIVDWCKNAKTKAFFNYQFLAALDITAEDVIALAKESLNEIDNGILVDAGRALQFLGLYDSIGSEDDNGDVKLLSRLMYTLNADPDMIKDIKVQADLRKLLKKFVTEMAWGRVPVDGTFAYVICDPRYLFGETGLQSGENWYNDMTCNYVAFRSPLIEYSEVTKLHMVKDNGLWWLKNLIVVNPFDDTLPRMGGADVDGDKLMITNHPLVLKSVAPWAPMIYDEGKSGIKVENNPENLVTYYINTTTRSNVGKITDLATTWNDISLHNGDRSLFGEYVACLRVYQGQEIDAAKTGYHPTVSKHLRTPFIPHWMVTMRGGMVGNDRQIYVSTSPIGKLHDFIMKYWEGLKEIKKAPNADMTLKFACHIDHEIVSKVSQIVIDLENDYRKDLAHLNQLVQAKVMTQDEANIQTEYLFAKYEALIDSLNVDKKTVAAIAYDTAYNKNNSKSYSFPWIACFSGLLELLYQNKNAIRMTAIPFTTDKTVPVRGAILEVNMEKHYIGNIPDGDYEVMNINGKSYIKVPYYGTPEYKKPVATGGHRKDIQDKYVGKEIVQFTITGFSHLGLTANAVVDTFKANNNEIAVVKSHDDQVVIYAGSTMIGVMSKYDKLNNVGIIGKLLKVSEHQDTQFVSTKTHKLELRKAFYLVATVIGDVDVSRYSTNSPIVITETDITDYNFEIPYSFADYNDYGTPIELPIYEVSEPVEENIEVVNLSAMTVEPVLDEKVMAGVKTSAPYWSVRSLATPKNVDSYTAMIINPNAKVGETVGSVTATKGERSFEFTVVRTETGLTIKSSFVASQEFCNWVLRVISYKAAEMRMR